MAVNTIPGSSTTGSVYGSDGVNTDTAVASKGSSSAASQSSMPDVQQNNTADLLNETPALAKPDSKYATMDFATLSALSADAIMSMLGFEERKSAVDSGLSEIETKRQQRQEINEQRIENLQQQAEKSEKSGLLDKIKEVFSYIGMALSALGAIAGLVASVATGNVALGIGSAILLLSTAEQIMSAASDGKLSLANGFAEAAKATGGNEQAARIAGMITGVAIGLTGAVLSAGAGIHNVVKESYVAAKQFANVMSNVVNVASAVNSMATGAVGIAKSVYDSQLTDLKASAVDLQAILMRIQTASDMDTELLKKVMEKSQDMVEGVKEIMDGCNQSLGAVVTGAPSMA